MSTFKRLLMEGQQLWLYIVVLLLCTICFWYRRRRNVNLPPGPVCLPIVGYLPFLGNDPFRTFITLGKSYGNIFSLYLGANFVVILNDIKAIKEAYLGPSILFRPPEFWSLIPDAVGFGSTNGPEWVEQRRFSFRVMKDLGYGKSDWERMVKEEIDELLQVLESHEGHAVDVAPLLGTRTTSNMWSFMFGWRLPEGHPTRMKIDHCVDVVPRSFVQSGLQVAFPTLSKIFAKLKIFGYGVVYEDNVAFNDIVKKEVIKRKAKMNEALEDIYVDEYLKEMKKLSDRNVISTFSESALRGNIQGLFLAGSDTTKVSILWLLLAMASFPETQKKVHKELDTVLNPGEQPSWSQRHNLPYTFATIMEGQRWKTTAPLALTRIASEDTKVCGYDIPKGTMIIPNLWNVHYDERYWKEPEKFCPEHFLDDENKLISRPLSYAPFSIGRRRCPAENIALIEIFFYFTAIMLNFEVLPPEDKPLTLEGSIGVLYTPIDDKLRFVLRSV